MNSVDERKEGAPQNYEMESSPSNSEPSGLRIIAHVILDAFFASVEQRLNPRLVGQPVIVSGRRADCGVVASASYEARELGVRAAMPLFRAYRICPHGHFLRGRHSEYARFANSVFQVCSRFSPALVRIHMDEGFLDFTATDRLPGDPKNARTAESWPFRLAQRLRDAVRTETGLNISVGVATTEPIAQVAANYARPNGLCFVRPGEEESFLGPMALSGIPGIAPRTADMLDECGFHTVADVLSVPIETLMERFGPNSAGMLYRMARGQWSDTLEISGGPESIRRETTFSRATADRYTLRTRLHRLTEKAAWKLRRLGLKARTVTVKLRYQDFHTVARDRSLGYYSDLNCEFYEPASELLDRLHTRPTCVRMVGVALSNFTDTEYRPLHSPAEPLTQCRATTTGTRDGSKKATGNWAGCWPIPCQRHRRTGRNRTG